MSTQVDVARNRNTRSYSRAENMRRMLWAGVHPLFRFSPRPLWGWRRWMLRRFGAVIGQQVRVHPTARITMPWHLRIDDHAAVGDYAILYALGPIHIGARAAISQYAHLCAGTHDWRDSARPLRKLPVSVGADAWICADAFVGPGVNVGAGAILGARAVAMRDLAAMHIGVGNPMQVRPRDD